MENTKKRKSYQFTRVVSSLDKRLKFLNLVNSNHLPFFSHCWFKQKSVFFNKKSTLYLKMKRWTETKGEEGLYNTRECIFTKKPFPLTFITVLPCGPIVITRERIWQKCECIFLPNIVVSSNGNGEINK